MIGLWVFFTGIWGYDYGLKHRELGIGLLDMIKKIRDRSMGYNT